MCLLCHETSRFFCVLNLLTWEFWCTGYIRHGLEWAPIPNNLMLAFIAISIDILLRIFLIAKQLIFL